MTVGVLSVPGALILAAVGVLYLSECTTRCSSPPGLALLILAAVIATLSFVTLLAIANGRARPAVRGSLATLAAWVAATILLIAG